MKKIMKYLLCVIGIMMLTACSSDSDPAPNATPDDPQTYKQTVSLPYTASEITVTLDNLKSEISGIYNVPSWMTIDKLSYSSGSPKIKISHLKNTELKTRECTVVVIAKSGDKVELTITQDALPEGTGIDDIHNGSTDQPGY